MANGEIILQSVLRVAIASRESSFILKTDQYVLISLLSLYITQVFIIQRKLEALSLLND